MTLRFLICCFLALGITHTCLAESTDCAEYLPTSDSDPSKVIEQAFELFELARQLKDSLPDSSIACYEQVVCQSEAFDLLGWKCAALCELSDIHLQQNKFQRSMELAREALELNDPSSEHYSTRRDFVVQSTLAKCHLKMNLPEEAIEFFKEALRVQRMLSEKAFANHIQTSYYNIGKSYMDLGDYLHADDYLSKAVLQYDDPKTGFKTYVYSLILRARVAHYMGKSVEGLELLSEAEKACDEQQTKKVPAKWYQSILYTRGMILQDNLAPTEAASNFEKVIDLGSKHNPRVVAKAKLRLAELYQQNNQSEAAARLILASLNEIQPLYGSLHPLCIVSGGKLARVLAENGQHAEAAAQFELASKEWIHLPVDSFQILEEHLIVLEDMAKYHFERGVETDQEESLLKAYKTINVATKRIEQLRSNFHHDESKRLLLGRVSSIFELAIEINKSLMEREILANELAFSNILALAERNKYVLLQDGLKESTALQYAGIPSDLLKQEKTIRTSIAAARKTYFESRDDNPELAARQLEILLDQKDKLKGLKSQFENEYPEYFQLKYEQPTFDLSSIQDQLSQSNAAAIEFFWGKNALYVIGVSEAKTVLHKIDDTDRIGKLVQLFRSSVSDRKLVHGNEKEMADRQLVESAASLYELLIQPAIEGLGQDVIKRLSIIPDKELSTIPFAALLVGHGELPVKNYSRLPYLIKHFEISYGFTLGSILKKNESNRTSKTTTEKVYGGYAPSYEGASQTNTAKIKGALLEVRNVASMLTGDAILGKHASEANFKKQASEYLILQLAMHAHIDDDNPLYNSFLLFDAANDQTEDNDTLTIAELYELKLNAHLAVLSACNTSSGSYRNGEGVISLARAFAFAGCPSLLSSQWLLPDRASSTIMTSFFEHLKKGRRKSESLREAQVQYLESINDPLYSHPYYWAGLMPIGDMQTISFPNNQRLFQLGMVFLGIFVFSVFGFRRKLVDQ